MEEKRKAITYLGYGLFISFMFLSVYVIFRLSRLEQGIIDAISGYGFAGILLFSFLADMIMQPIGPDLPMVAGIIIGLNPLACLFFAVLGSFAATVAGYHLGKAYGEAGFMKFYGYARYEKWRRKYEKYGKIIVVIAAVTPVPYVPICWLSGMFRMRYLEFLAFAMIPRTLRLMGVVFLTVNIIKLG